MFLIALVTSPLRGSRLLADHSGLQDGWVLSKCTLHFNGSKPVAAREKQTLPSVLSSPMKLQREKERAENLTLRNCSHHYFFPWTKSSHPCLCGLSPLWCKSPLVLMLLSFQNCPEIHSEPMKSHLGTVTQDAWPEQPHAEGWGPLNRKSSG